MEYRNKNGNTQGETLLQRISTVAWPHINFGGRFELNKHDEPINMNDLIQELAQAQVLLEPNPDNE